MSLPLQCAGRLTQDDQVQSIHHMPLDASTPDGAPPSYLLTEYFRAPADLLTPLRVDESSLKKDPGYFNLGSDTVCYGRISGEKGSQQLDGDLDDALAAAKLEGPLVTLPFGADEAVQNLRRERYTAHFREEGNILNEFVRKAYYVVRPLLGVPVRRHLQKMHLRGWEDISFPAWPVDTTVERIHKKLLALCLRARGLDRLPFVWFWPKGFSSCMIMTHDVEDHAGKKFCGTLMDLDEAGGIRSSSRLSRKIAIP